jgi:hypothetical protein
VRIGNSARGDRIPLRLSGLPFRKGALGERDRKNVTETATIVKKRHRTRATGLRFLTGRYHKKPMHNVVVLLAVDEAPLAPLVVRSYADFIS